MSNIISTLQNAVAQAVGQIYSEATDPAKVQINTTPPDFTGDYSVVVFPFVKIAKKAPDAAAAEIGDYLQKNVPEVKSFNVVKGFLNLEISDVYWQNFLQSVVTNPGFGRQPRNGRKVMVEYSSPNTNKPLHLGHIRNILLGWSCAQILEAVGCEVVKTQIVNDRGVAICKSMLSWEKWGDGKTPESAGIKPDHFVGDWYVLFEQKSKEAYEAWQQSDEAKRIFETNKKANQAEKEFFREFKNKWFNEHSALGAEVREMLLKWEAHEPATMALWNKMNNWVYEGFEQTYKDLGVSFDRLYHESDTYLLGKDIVEEGLAKGVFFKKDDGSVWVDLTDAGYDQKVVLRADGTSVYITQDLGTAQMRHKELGCERYVYVVADEQNYHFQVLFEILRRLGEPYAKGLHHLSYGLVELPTGRMKTREGTVVDADDLVAEVIRLAAEQASERGEIEGVSPQEKQENLRKVGMGALKFFIVKVHPKRKMIFNPEESVDLQGQTGPYIQYSYVRINGLMQRVEKENVDVSKAGAYTGIQTQEKELLVALHDFPNVIQKAAEEYDPSLIANFCYDLAKKYHRFWHDLSIFNADTAEAKAFRLQLSRSVGQVLKSGMELLGIEMPNRM
ncbi:MAG: arginine--tRNA ligase [Haliscomenobacteraceae bacterium CHB4]|nr:Arginine--tRNA ligase [Saprospiraceae bacterium]MCE7922023.1 arginine--tRNA ligase [Haliscomenobacteraceae bacterium CHB4]